jgi:phospholipase A-2-activating protein
MSIFQSLPHPCCVWAVLPLQSSYDGDFLTAGNDGIIRYFSRNPALTSLSTSEQLTLQLLAEVEELRSKRRKGPSDEDLAKVTKWELRGSQVGKSEGQVMLFNKDQRLIAAQWSMASQVWIEVGEVTATENRGEISGVEYDHVLPVEIETPTGLRNLQLGYNNGENPFVAAQRFIDSNELNQGYLAQIADWITQRAGQSSAPTLDMAGSSQTRSSAPAAAAASVVSQISYPHGIRACTVFDDQPTSFASKVTAKIQEFNALVASGRLSDADLDNLASLLKVLAQTSFYHSSNIIATQLKPLAMILAWNDPQRTFPAYDILRLVAVHPAGAVTLASNPLFVDAIGYAVQYLRSRETSSPALLLTSLRFLANCYRQEPLRIALLRSLSPSIVDVLDTIHLHVVSTNKSVRLAVAYHLLNYAVAITSSSTVTRETWLQSSLSSFLTSSLIVMSKESESYDAAYAVVLAVGTVMASTTIPGDVLAGFKAEAKKKEIIAVFSTTAATFPSTQIPTVVADIRKMLLKE